MQRNILFRYSSPIPTYTGVTGTTQTVKFVRTKNQVVTQRLEKFRRFYFYYYLCLRDYIVIVF